MANVAQQSEIDSGLCSSGGENPHESPHCLGVMHEDVGVSGHAMPQVYTGKSCATPQMTRDSSLARTNEIENEIRNDPAIEGLRHHDRGSRSAAATREVAAS